jgi:hypothetical protein
MVKNYLEILTQAHNKQVTLSNPTAVFIESSTQEWVTYITLSLLALIAFVAIAVFIVVTLIKKKRLPKFVFPALLIPIIICVFSANELAHIYDSYLAFNNTTIQYNPRSGNEKMFKADWSNIKSITLSEKTTPSLSITFKNNKELFVNQSKFPQLTDDSLKTIIYDVYAEGLAVDVNKPTSESSERYKNIYAYATDPLVRKDAVVALIEKHSPFTPEETAIKEKMLSKIPIPDNDTARRVADHLYLFPYGISVPTANEEKSLYLSGDNNFTVEYPKEWVDFPLAGTNPVFLSPETRTPDGELNDRFRAFTVSVSGDCTIDLRNRWDRFAATDDFDDFIEIELHDNPYRKLPKKITAGPEVLNQYENLGPVTHYHWHAPYKSFSPVLMFSGDLEIDDYFFKQGDQNYKISFTYNTQFKDRYWASAEDMLRSFTAPGKSCVENTGGIQMNDVDYFFPEYESSLRRFFWIYTFDEGFEIIEDIRAAGIKEKSTWYAPPAPVQSQDRRQIKNNLFIEPPVGTDGILYKCDINEKAEWFCVPR